MWVGERRGLGETQREAQLEGNRKLSPGFAAGGGPLDASQCLDFPIPAPYPPLTGKGCLGDGVVLALG